MLLSLILSTAMAQDIRAWQGMVEGMLIETYDQDPVQAIEWYEGIWAALPSDSDSREEIAYWLGRALYAAGETERAIETLEGVNSREASSLLNRIDTHQVRIASLPHEESFRSSLGAWRHSWLHEGHGEIRLGAPPGGDSALMWSTTVTEHEEDSVRVEFDASSANPRSFRLSMRSESFPAYVQPTLFDAEGRRFSEGEAIELPRGEWVAIDLSSRGLTGGAAPTRGFVAFELRDVTSQHSTDRGTNTLYIGDVVIE